MTQLQQDVRAQLRAIAVNEMDSHSAIAERALAVIDSTLGHAAQKDAVIDRLKRELTEERQRLIAAQNTAHNLDKRHLEDWRLLLDAKAVLLRAEAAIPVEKKDALDVIEKFLNRLEPPAPPAKETPK